MIASYNGTYLTGLNDDVAGYIAGFCDPNEILQFDRITSHNLWALPIPWQFEPPPVRVNVLNWPTGASRFATFYAVMDDNDLQAIRAAAFTVNGPVALPLSITDGGETIVTDLYALPPTPLEHILGYVGLWLVPLVDVRYFWWYKSADFTVGGTWADLFSDIGTELNETLNVSAVPADYGNPTSKFVAYQQPVPLYLDAAAYAVGMKVVRTLSGDVYVQSYTDAAVIEDAQLALVPTRSERSGGQYHVGECKRSAPETVSVVFPRSNSGTPVEVPFVIDEDLATLALPAFTASGTISLATNTVPIVITTTAPHGLVTGDLVDIVGVLVNTAANGTWPIVVVDATKFELYNSVANGLGVTGTWDATVIGLADTQKVWIGDGPTATFSGGPSPTNLTTLQAYAVQAASDWYNWQQIDVDWQFNGMVDWTANGQIDQIEYWLARDRVTTRVSRAPYNDLIWGNDRKFITVGSGGGGGGLTTTIDRWRYVCESGINKAYLSTDTYVDGLLTIKGIEAYDHDEGCCDCNDPWDLCCEFCPDVTPPETLYMRICCGVTAIDDILDKDRCQFGCVWRSRPVTGNDYTITYLAGVWTLNSDDGNACPDDSALPIDLTEVSCDPVVLFGGGPGWTVEVNTTNTFTDDCTAPEGAGCCTALWPTTLVAHQINAFGADGTLTYDPFYDCGGSPVTGGSWYGYVSWGPAADELHNCCITIFCQASVFPPFPIVYTVRITKVDGGMSAGSPTGCCDPACLIFTGLDTTNFFEVVSLDFSISALGSPCPPDPCNEELHT